MATVHADIQLPNAALHAARAGEAAIAAAGMVPNTAPAALKHATATPAHPA